MEFIFSQCSCTNDPQSRLYAVSGESRKVLAVFAFLTVAQLALGVVFIAKARNTREETPLDEDCPYELTYIIFG